MAQTDTLLEEVRLDVKVTTTAYDVTLLELIDGAIIKMNRTGIPVPTEHAQVTDPLHRRAIKTYVKAHFIDENPDYDKLMRSWAMQLSYMLGTTGYHFPEGNA